jgi:1,4-alpha-glucan branching enzyme
MASLQISHAISEWFTSLPRHSQHAFAYEVWRAADDNTKYHNLHYGMDCIRRDASVIQRTSRYKMMCFAHTQNANNFAALPKKIQHVFAKQVPGSYQAIHSDYTATRSTDIFRLFTLLNKQSAEQLTELSQCTKNELYHLVYKTSQTAHKSRRSKYGEEKTLTRPSILAEWTPTEVKEPDIITWMISRMALRHLIGQQAVDIRDKIQCNLHEVYGSHPRRDGVDFTLYAPNARDVWVEIFQQDGGHIYQKMDETLGTWHIHIQNSREGDHYKYHILGSDGHMRVRGDPYSLSAKPDQISQVISRKSLVLPVDPSPFSHRDKMTIYEVHIPTCGFGSGSFASSAEHLAIHVSSLGFTHVQLLPHVQTSEKSACYNARTLMAPNSAMGTLNDFRYFVDTMHAKGVKVLGDFSLYHMDHKAFMLEMKEPDPKNGKSPWGMPTYNYKDQSVRSYLGSTVDYWLTYLDGMRIDATGCMFFLNHIRDGLNHEYTPNADGSVENHEAIQLLKEILSYVRSRHPTKVMIAEEFCPQFEDWVTHSHDSFHLSWSSFGGTINYMAKEGFSAEKLAREHWIAHKKWAVNAFQNHDTGRIATRLPWKSGLSQMRQLLALTYFFPGTPQVWMGDEFASRQHWHEQEWLERSLQGNQAHSPIMNLTKQLNKLQEEACFLYSKTDASQFAVVHSNTRSNLLAYRRGHRPFRSIVVHNFGGAFPKYHIPLNQDGVKEIRLWLNTEEKQYGGLSDNLRIEKVLDGTTLHNLPPNCTICIEEVF